MTRTGIDISHWQGNIDFEKIPPNIEFVIIKAGGSDKGFYKDSRFDEYYKKAKENNFKVGAYYFVGKNCKTYEDGVADADRFLKIIKGKQFEYPVVIDLESTSPNDKCGVTEAVIGFCTILEVNGYYACIYASDISGFKDRLISSELTMYDKWVARYGSEPQYIKDYGLWQFTSKGEINGINGFVDLDISFKDYETIMKKKHLNGF